MHGVLNAFFEAALGKVHGLEGTINQFLGDGFMALFGAPVAHEDHARRAVLAALAIRSEIAARSSHLVSLEDGLQLRIGLNSGSVVVGKIGDNLRMDYTAVGDTTNVAARLQQLADPGMILISGSVFGAVQDYVDCKALGARSLKGKSEPVAIYQVLRSSPIHRADHRQRLGGSNVSLVGRAAELATITESIERLARGRGGILSIIGEAGLGKSRLLEEARCRAQSRNLRWLEGAALSFGRTLSYWPFRDILKRWFDIGEEDTEQECWAKLRAKVTPLFPDDADELLPYVGVILALPVTGPLAERVKYLDGLAIGHQIYRTSLRLFERLARECPLVLVFEDWHWADASSVELLEHLLPLVNRAPIVFCIASRPGPQGAGARLGQVITADERLRESYHEMVLAPLAGQETAQLALSLLAEGTLPPHIRDPLLRRAAGNPFFLGELIRALLETGGLEYDEASGIWHASWQFEVIPLPDTLQGVILARIDRLEEDAKLILKTASVIGQNFFYRVLRAISEAEIALDEDLDELQRVELIGEKQRMPELEYVFKHPLIQEATYESILEDRRRRLHQRIGECVELLFADRLEEFYSVLAYHFAQAEDWAKAQEYLFKAGDHAGSVAADTEALEHYRHAVAAYEKVYKGRWDPLQRAGLDRKIGEALFRTGQNEQALAYLHKARRSLGTSYPASRGAIRFAIAVELLRQGANFVLQRLGFRRQSGGQLAAADAEAYRILEVMAWIDFFLEPERFMLDVLMMSRAAQKNTDSPEFVASLAYTGLIFDAVGIYWLAERYHLRAKHLSEKLEQPLALAHCYQFRGLHEYHVGELDAALSSFARSRSAYWDTGYLRGWAGATCMSILVMCSKGEPGWIPLARDLREVADETQDHQMQAWAKAALALEYARGNLYETAVNEFETAAKLTELVPDYRILAYVLAELAVCHLKQENIDRALNVVQRSIQLLSDHKITGTSATRPIMVAAEANLLAAEQASGDERGTYLRKSKKACSAAIKQGKRVRDDGAPDALRLSGIFAWLDGNPAKAERLWNQSLRVAKDLGARYVLAQTHFELGKRLKNRDHLVQAEELFLAAGAQGNLLATRQLLNDSTVSTDPSIG